MIVQVVKQLVSEVIVHKENLSELRRLSSIKEPLLILPSHRSYLDFVLVTWLLHSYNINTPLIAAGQVT